MRTDEAELERARAELKRLGYLHEGFERFLLQDALRPQRPLPALLRLTAKVGLAAGSLLALPAAFALSVANGSVTAAPLDTPVLFLHLFLPVAAVAALLFLGLAGLLIAFLRRYPARRAEGLALGVALAAGGLGLGGALWTAWGRWPEMRAFEAVLLGVLAPAAAFLLVRLVYHGLLALAVRFTGARLGPERFPGRLMGWGILVVALALTLPALLSVRHPPEAPPDNLPQAAGERVLLLGIDGVRPRELEYLLALGDLPTMGRLARSGGRLLAYSRKEEPPASFWTTVATGRPGPEHGVAALDSFRPLGVAVPLSRNGPLRPWWSRVEVPLGLAEYRPLLANRRAAYTVWELAARGGAPVAAVNWWATFPAEPLSGRVVAHGAYQLLEEGAAGAVAPPDDGALATLLAAVRQTPLDGHLAAALPPPAARQAAERAFAPDRFYRAALLASLAGRPRAAALYLPALDIAADGWAGGEVAFTDLLRGELTRADGLLAQALAGPDGPGTVAVVFDPGRRERLGTGRILLWRRAGCPSGGGGETTPAAVASSLLRALGLPQSAELPPPAAQCRWPEPPAILPTYGPRAKASAEPRNEDREYLENLRSLGYL